MVVMVVGLKPHCMAELSDEPAESFTYEYVFAIHFDLLIPSLLLQRMTGALCLRCKIPGLTCGNVFLGRPGPRFGATFDGFALDPLLLEAARGIFVWPGGTEDGTRRDLACMRT